MEKAKASSNVAHLDCPVLPIAVRVGELWDAHAGATEHENCSEATAEQIYRLRAAVEELASFERARSPAGALFQVGLALDAAVSVFDRVPEGDKFKDPTWQKLIRLLDSVALVLRDACMVEEYQVVKDVVKIYMSIEGQEVDHPFKWREEIPDLAKEYRSTKVY